MSELLPLAVTTSTTAEVELVSRGRHLADKLSLPFVPRRRKQALTELIARCARAFLVVEKSGIALADVTGRLRWSPQLAALRVRRLEAGIQEDTLVRMAQFNKGDRVLDCMLGLGQDTLVAAHAVGPDGSVIALEKSIALYAIAADGLSGYGHLPERGKVELHHVDCAKYLRNQPSRTFDVILFDPMFERSTKSTPGFEMLRRYADYGPLTNEMVSEARRVARRWVVVKASRYSKDLKKLNLVPEPGSRFSAIHWARLPAQ